MEKGQTQAQPSCIGGLPYIGICICVRLHIDVHTNTDPNDWKRFIFRFKRFLYVRTYICPLNTIERNTAQINAIFGGIFAYCLYMYNCAYNMLILPHNVI